MTREEKIALFEIDSLFKEMLEEPKVTGRGKYTQKPNGYNYCRNARKMQDKILELQSRFKSDYLTKTSIEALDNTIKKEVSHVEKLYNLSIKNNAPKKHHSDFLNSMSKVNRQIEKALSSLFAETKKVLNDL